MVISDDEARKEWASEDFKAFLAQLRSGTPGDLRTAAELVSGTGVDRDLSDVWALNVKRATVWLLAEYVRRKHAGRVPAIVADPMTTLGLPSPRTGLLPERLFRTLGDICRSHGMSFEETMLLPKEVSGMGGDVAHPRLIACLLRVGDLLDLDNGRFCPVLLKSSGTLPALSTAHIEKHAAINKFLVTPELIEVEAECNSYLSYEVTWEWLSWLKSEIQAQMLNWHKIAPSNLGALPSLGEIRTLQKGFIALTPGQAPRFEIDKDSVLRALQGVNLYEDREECLREVIQNAIDATLLRFWLERENQVPPFPFDALSPTTLRRELEVLPIRVDLTMAPAPDPEHISWDVSVQDQGTGISFSDVRYLMTIGSSRKNAERARAIQAMPDWMRPSGIFGIGLQSAFLLTNEVTLLTRHYDTRDAYEIILRSNQETPGRDLISIRRLDGKLRAATPIGTKVSFRVTVGSFPERANTDFAFREAATLIRNYDPTVSPTLPYLFARCKDLVRHLGEQSLCTVHLNGPSTRVAATDDITKFQFDKEHGCEMLMTFSAEGGRPNVRYRGAPVEINLFDKLVSGECNLHAGTAEHFLVLNREKFSRQGAREFRARVAAARRKLLPDRLRGLRTSDPAQAKYASLAGASWGIPDHGEEWRTIELQGEGNIGVTSLGQLLEYKKVIYIERKSDRKVDMLVQSKTGADEIRLCAPDLEWLHELLRRALPNVYFDGHGETVSGMPEEIYIYSKTSVGDPITEKGIRDIITRTNIDFRRTTIPCMTRFKVLSYADEWPDGFQHLLHWLTPRMVNPFEVTYSMSGSTIALPNLRAFVDWTHAHALDSKVSKSEIAAALLEFIRHFEPSIDHTKYRKTYAFAQVETELISIRDLAR